MTPDTVIGTIWATWTIYLAMKTIKGRGAVQLGYFLSSCLTGYTAFLLME